MVRPLKAAQPARGESGQAFTEYVLLLVLVTLIYALIVRQFKAMDLADKLLIPLREQYAYTYRYGDPRARGPDDGGPIRHPRAVTGSNDNFRLFLNPESKQ